MNVALEYPTPVTGSSSIAIIRAARKEMQLPSSLYEWQVLNAKVESFFKTSTTLWRERMIWFVTISGPIAGFLYLLSAWKRWKSSGRWIVRVDDEGYIQPHTHVVIPFWAVAFTCVNLAQSISLLIDCKSQLHTRTVVFSLISYPVLSCFVWSLLYAMPPSKFRLAQVNQKIGSPSQNLNRCFTATSFNLIIIVGYLLSLLGPTTWIILALKDAFQIFGSWNRHQSMYPRIIKSLSDQTPALGIELQTLLLLNNMLDTGENFKKNLNYMTAVFFLLTTLHVIVVVCSSYRILAALYYQVMILRQAGKRLKAIRMKQVWEDYEWSHTSQLDGNLKIASTPKSEVTTRTTGVSPDTSTFKLGMRRYLPTFKRGTGVSAALWKSGSFRKTQAEIVDGGVKDMKFYYRQLRRYAMNSFWQTVIAAAVMLSYVVLTFILRG